jgi:hypothetical protein
MLIVGVSLVGLQRQGCLGVARVDADDRQPARLQLVKQPNREHAGLDADAHSGRRVSANKLFDVPRCKWAFATPKRPTSFVDNAGLAFVKRHIETNVLGKWDA